MSEKVLKLFGFSIMLCVFVICITTFICKWFEVVYRNPENNAKLNIVGYIAIGLLEPLTLALIGYIYLMVA